MEEAGDLVGEAAVHVVDEGIEDLGRGGEGEDVVVGKYSWYQGAMPFGQHNLFFEL